MLNTVSLFFSHMIPGYLILIQFSYKQGGSTDNLGGDGFLLQGAQGDISKFGENFLNYRITQKHILKTNHQCENGGAKDALLISQVPRKQFVGFFWGLSKELSDSLLLSDGSGRLINTTARLNFGQETEISERLGHGTDSSSLIFI